MLASLLAWTISLSVNLGVNLSVNLSASSSVSKHQVSTELLYSALRHARLYSKNEKTGALYFIGSAVSVDKGKYLTAKHVVDAKDWSGNKLVPVILKIVMGHSGQNPVIKEVAIKSFRTSDKTDLALVYTEEDVGLWTEVGTANVSDRVYMFSAGLGENVFATGEVNGYEDIAYSSDEVQHAKVSMTFQVDTTYRIQAMAHSVKAGGGSSGAGIYKGNLLVGVHVARAIASDVFGYAVSGREIAEFLKRPLDETVYGNARETPVKPMF